MKLPHIDSFDLSTYSHKTCPTWKYRLSVWIAAISEHTSHYCRQATYVATRRRSDGMQGKYGYIWGAFVSFVCCCLTLLMLAPVGLVQIRQPSFVSRGCESVTDTNDADRQWRLHLMSKLKLLHDSLILKKCQSLITIFCGLFNDAVCDCMSWNGRMVRELESICKEGFVA
jgi:hypothetical protein